jgi:hypothetical protein
MKAHRVFRSRGSYSFTQLTDGDEIVSHTRRPHLPSGRSLVHSSVSGWMDPRAAVRMEKSCIRKGHSVLKSAINVKCMFGGAL